MILPDDEGKTYDPKPTPKRIGELFDQIDVSAALMNHSSPTWVEVINVNSFVFAVRAPWA